MDVETLKHNQGFERAMRSTFADRNSKSLCAIGINQDGSLCLVSGIHNQEELISQLRAMANMIEEKSKSGPSIILPGK